MSTLLVSAGILFHGGRVLITQRKESMPYPHFWEFPGGKVEPGEDPRDAIKRELREELAISVEVVKVFDVVFYRYPERDVLIVAFICAWIDGDLQELEVAAHRWVTVAELSNYILLPADEPLVKLLQAMN